MKDNTGHSLTKRHYIPKSSRIKILQKYGGKCAYCGCNLTMKTMCIDHIYPIRKGGKLPQTYTSTGLVRSCIKKYLLEKFNHRCAKCGWHEINEYTGRIPLEVHHLDGNWKNNNEDNLVILCPNCHSLTNNYKGRNRGRGRSTRL